MTIEIIVSDTNGLMTADGASVQFVASFDVTTVKVKAKAFNASQSADEKLDDHVGDVIEAISVEDDLTGEVGQMFTHKVEL